MDTGRPQPVHKRYRAAVQPRGGADIADALHLQHDTAGGTGEKPGARHALRTGHHAVQYGAERACVGVGRLGARRDGHGGRDGGEGRRPRRQRDAGRERRRQCVHAGAQRGAKHRRGAHIRHADRRQRGRLSVPAWRHWEPGRYRGALHRVQDRRAGQRAWTNCEFHCRQAGGQHDIRGYRGGLAGASGAGVPNPGVR